MRSILLFCSVLAVSFCQFAIPEEFKDAKDAIESDYYKEAVENIFKDHQIPVSTRGGRIAGGEKATIGQFPFHALLYMADDEGRRYICGGVLIKYDLVLTVCKL
jgi:hypothetical protein